MPLGVIAISAAAINDVIGWLLLALVTTLTVANFVAFDFATRVALVASLPAGQLVRAAAAPEAGGAPFPSRARAGSPTISCAYC